MTVYMSPAVIDWPHWVPLAAGTSWIRLLSVSAMYRSPAESTAMPTGACSAARDGGRAAVAAAAAGPGRGVPAIV